MAKITHGTKPTATERYANFTNWIQQEHGLTIDPSDAMVAVQTYHDFQASPMNQEANAKRKEENAAKRAARSEGWEERQRVAAEKRKEREAKATEREQTAAQRKAEREQKAQEREAEKVRKAEERAAAKTERDAAKAAAKEAGTDEESTPVKAKTTKAAATDGESPAPRRSGKTKGERAVTEGDGDEVF